MNTLFIRSRGDLLQAQRLNGWFNRPDISRVSIQSVRMDRQTRQSMEQRVSNLFNECGCGVSAAVLVAASIAIFVVQRDPASSWAPQLGFAVLKALIPATAAKAIVLAIAHLRLNAVLRQVERLI